MRQKLVYLAVSLLFLTGVGLVLYPVVSDWYIGRHQASVVASYDEEAARLSQEQIEIELARAHAYNESLLGNVVLTDPFDAEGLAEQNTEYDDLLNINGDSVMGSIDIPRVDIYLPIYHTTDAEVLAKGAGHLKNSSLPVGGTGTHAIISGHTALPSAELFNNLSDVEKGDVFYIHVLNETLAYEVDQIKVVLPDNIEDLLINRNEDYVTLVTCTPYGINSHRLLVRGRRIPYEEAEAITPVQQVEEGFRYKSAYVAAGIVAAAILLAVILSSIIKRRKQK